MALREQTAISGLKSEREKFGAIDKSALTYGAFAEWLAAGQSAFQIAVGKHMGRHQGGCYGRHNSGLSEGRLS